LKSFDQSKGGLEMKTKTWINLVAALILLVASFGVVPLTQSNPLAATIVRVKPGGSTTPGCGATWATACELQTAFTGASAGDEIWVAAGIYKPGTNRDDTFQLISGVALYGGFAGTETSRGQRDWEANPTVLSGDIGVPDDSSDNSYHVVFIGMGVDTTAILDGFTIIGGNADGSGWPNGGGLIINSYSDPTLTNLIFIGNHAKQYGGGIYMDASGPRVINVIFNGNSAGDSGGGMYNMFACPLLTNVTFSGNTAGNYGGGMVNASNYSCETSLTNVIFSGNSANFGGGMYNIDSISPTLINTIMWGNSAGTAGSHIYNYYGATPSITYSNVQGGCETIPGNDCSGGGNIDADPLFMRKPDPGPDGTWGTTDDDYGDLRLKYGSPAIDSGDNSAHGLTGITTDLDGNPRFVDIPSIPDTGVGPSPVVDMGAFERQPFNELYLPLTIR
jgi:predicted outer membrane repeat protein